MWTHENRPKYNRDHLRYPSDLTDDEWGVCRATHSTGELDAGGMDDGMQQQTQRIDENMPLFALDQLARIEPVWIDAGPPFSALFTL